MFDRYQGGEHAVLVHLDLHEDSKREELQEFLSLVSSAGIEQLALVTGKLSSIHPKFFVGTGKADEIAAAVAATGAQVVIFDHALTPAQERNLEKLCSCRVVDRTGLILDIFAQRARTFEGKLQVELAQLQHMSTRLVRGWTHLERQKGGIGMRGPGETQLETDRRLLRIRIGQIERRIAKVVLQREQGRKARAKAGVPTVAIVGYTNAGKSSLFNRLTDSKVYAANQLFATLDPTLRNLDLPHAGQCILVDTVGFIRHLPHDLVASFRATLQETCDADLLLHVVDAADERRQAHIEQVDLVLKEIGADQVPRLMLYNKIDLMPEVCAHAERDDSGTVQAVWASAASGQGLNLLCQVLDERLSGVPLTLEFELPASAGRLRSLLHQSARIQSEQADEQGGLKIQLSIAAREWQILAERYPELEQYRLAVSSLDVNQAERETHGLE